MTSPSETSVRPRSYLASIFLPPMSPTTSSVTESQPDLVRPTWLWNRTAYIFLRIVSQDRHTPALVACWNLRARARSRDYLLSSLFQPAKAIWPSSGTTVPCGPGDKTLPVSSAMGRMRSVFPQLKSSVLLTLYQSKQADL